MTVEREIVLAHIDALGGPEAVRFAKEMPYSHEGTYALLAMGASEAEIRSYAAHGFTEGAAISDYRLLMKKRWRERYKNLPHIIDALNAASKEG